MVTRKYLIYYMCEYVFTGVIKLSKRRINEST